MRYPAPVRIVVIRPAMSGEVPYPWRMSFEERVPQNRPLPAILVVLATIAVGALALQQAFKDTTGANELSVWSLILSAIWVSGGLLVLVLSRPFFAEIPAWVRGSFFDLARFTPRRHPLRFSLISGAIVAAVSLGGALVFQQIPFFGDDVSWATSRVSDHRFLIFAAALLTGACEEVFFRLALHQILSPRFAVVGATTLYALVTLAGGNASLVLAAIVLGASCSIVLQRTGRWYSPIIIHSMWTVALVGIFPLLGA